MIKKEKSYNLRQLGYQRLENKKQRMRNLLKIAKPDDALYREIMLSLGYKNNKIPFLELATLLPYSEIKKLAKKEAIEKAMLYRAGFIEDKSGIPEFFDFSLRMTKDAWTHKGTRPVNFPEKRIEQISHLLAETIEKGIFSYFKNKIESSLLREPDKKNVKKIVNQIISFKGIGSSRQEDIFFNIIIPFFLVCYEEENNYLLKDLLEQIINCYPPSTEYRDIVKKICRKYFTEELPIKTIIEFFGLLEISKDKVNG